MTSDSEDIVTYEERRGFTGTYLSMVVVMVGTLLFVVLEGLVTGDPPLLVLGPVAGIAAFCALVLWLFGTGPLGTERRHIRVDAEGLLLRGRRLPAEQIGVIELLTVGQAKRAAGAMRRNGVWLGPGRQSVAFLAGDDPAVFIEQHRPDSPRPRGWLIATTDPEGLRRALQQTRDAPAAERTGAPTKT